MSHLLTDDDVRELTGAEQPAAQARVLREHGLHPVIRRDGRPRVTWEAVTQAMISRRSAEPDFSSINRAA